MLSFPSAATSHRCVHHKRELRKVGTFREGLAPGRIPIPTSWSKPLTGTLVRVVKVFLHDHPRKVSLERTTLYCPTFLHSFLSSSPKLAFPRPPPPVCSAFFTTAMRDRAGNTQAPWDMSTLALETSLPSVLFLRRAAQKDMGTSSVSDALAMRH